MNVPAALKLIGRGKDGARRLDETQACELFAAALDGRLSDVQLGAFLMAMRIKGESTAELTGFLRAAQQRALPLCSPAPVVLLPSYNGSRKLPNLTPLLARRLTLAGHRVLVHGTESDPDRITSADLFAALRWPVVRSLEALHEAWGEGLPAFMSVDLLCPGLARMIGVRRAIGVRGPGHTIAKLLHPVSPAPSLRVVNYTHPEYARAHAEFLQHSGADALLMRGSEGEPVADPRRQPRIEVFIGGTSRPDLSVDLQGGSLPELPPLPTALDTGAMAAYVAHLLDHPQKIPAPIERQVTCISACMRALAG